MAEQNSGRRQHLLGLLLAAEGLIDKAQLTELLAEQAQRREVSDTTPFGQLALSKGMITQAQLDWGLALQERMSSAPAERKKLGFYLLDAALVKPSHLSDALDAQQAGGGQLGELLIARGVITAEQLQIILNIQEWSSFGEG